MNRVLVAIEKTKNLITERLNLNILTKEKVEQSRITLNMQLDEYCAFQEMKSLATITGKLSLEEAQTIYILLGNSPTTFNNQPYEVKYILTKIYMELLNHKIKSHS